MNTSKNTFIAKTIALAVLFLSYFYSTIVVSDFFGNLLSPINAFAAEGILFYAYLESDRKKTMTIAFLVYSFACFSWAITDTVWAVMDLMGGDPMNHPVVNLLYFLPNVFITAALIISGFPQIKRWSMKQIVVDSITIITMTIVLLWVVFFNKDIALLQDFIREGFVPTATIATDLIIVVCIFIWHLSIREGKIPLFIRIISFGVFLYAINDIYYFRLELLDAYYPNTIVDAIYMFSFQVIAFGALWKIYKHGPDIDLTGLSNTGSRKRWLYLLFIPLVSIVLAGFDPTSLLIYGFLILFNLTARYLFIKQILIP